MTRLSPLQATIAISVVDRLALPAGEEFIGIIRVQDVRATEKDKVKIGESFRGGDVVRGTVVREYLTWIARCHVTRFLICADSFWVYAFLFFFFWTN